MSQLFTCTSTTRPSGSSLNTGDLFFETDTNKLIFWDGVIWRIYNSDGTLPGTGGLDELHYPAGLWSSSTSTYFVNTAPMLHFDYNYVDGLNPTNFSTIDGTVVKSSSSFGSPPGWSSRVGDYVIYSKNSTTSHSLVHNSSRKGVHARKFADSASTIPSNAHIRIGSSSSNATATTVNNKSFTYFLVISSNSLERSGAIPAHNSVSTSSIISGQGANHSKLGGEALNMGAPSETFTKDNGDPMVVVVRSNGARIDAWFLNSENKQLLLAEAGWQGQIFYQNVL